MLMLNIVIAFIVLVIATVTDLKKREVPDYISYGLIFVSLTSTLLYSIIYSDYNVLVQSLLGFIIGLIIAFSMFYLGQWGGGDSKLIMGLGAVFGFNVFPLFGETNYWLLILLANIILLGAIYGMVWSIFLAIRNRKLFMKKTAELMNKKTILWMRRIILALVIVLLAVTWFLVPGEYKMLIIGFIAMFYVVFYIWLFVKIIEESCMVKSIPVPKLTEGDWIYENVYNNKTLITGPKDLGVSKKQIVTLMGLYKKKKILSVKIKEGIPFIPAFLLAFIATMILYYVGIF